MTDAGGFSFWGSQGFFRPGVRLFRKMRFAGKAWIISAAFAIPMALLTWSFVTTKNEGMAVAMAEWHGSQYLRALWPVWRNETAPESLSSAQREHGAVLSNAAAEQALRNVVSGNPAAKTSALMGLLSTTADNSGLVLDPESASYYAMDVSLLALPDLVNQVRALAAAQAAGDAGAVDAGRADALLGALIDRIGVGLDKVRNERSEFKAQLDPQALQAAAKALQANKAVDRSSVLAQTAEAAAWSLQSGTQKALDALLMERHERLKSELTRTLVLQGVCIAAAAYLFYCFALVLGGGIRFVTERVNHVAEGVLNGPSHAWGTDEFSYVASRVAEMQKSLTQTMKRVSTTAFEVAQGSQTLSVSTADLAGRAGDAAEHLRATAGTMGQMQGVASQAGG